MTEQPDIPPLLTINATVNGDDVEVDVDHRMTLADMLRHELGLTGTKLGCEHGVCGACTVLIDGRSARACLTLAAQAAGTSIETVESLSADGDLSPLQEAFREKHGLQCGFCTAGILMTLTELERHGPYPGDEESAREALGGNICRCTGYQSIVDAILAAHPGAPAPSEGT